MGEIEVELGSMRELGFFIAAAIYVGLAAVGNQQAQPGG